MKTIFIMGFLFFCCTNGQAQEFAGFQIIDYIRTIDHPNCSFSKNKFIIGPPNDSMWVNVADTSIIYGDFGSPWINGEGEEIILHTAFNLDKYLVKLKLIDGSYSAAHLVLPAHWESLEDNPFWTYLFDDTNDCIVNSGIANQRIVKLDFKEDFNLTPSERVVGIEITLLPTSAGTDISGIYITDNALPCKQVELGNDMIMCSSDSTIISPGKFKSYLWSDWSIDSVLLIDGALFDEATYSFDVTVEDENGCKTKDTISITIERCWDFEVESTCNNIILYPNPVDQYLNFQFQNFVDDKELLIYSADGRLFSQFILNRNNLSLDISTYASGIYFAKTNNSICKFIKQSSR